MPVIINGDIINDADDRASEWRENRREEEENGTEWDFSEEETEEDKEDRWEDEKEERKEHFDRRFVGSTFGVLASALAESFRLESKDSA